MGQALARTLGTRADMTPPGGTGEIVEEVIQTRPTGGLVIPLPTRLVTLPGDEVEQRRKSVTSVLPHRVEAENEWRDVMEEERKKTHTTTSTCSWTRAARSGITAVPRGGLREMYGTRWCGTDHGQWTVHINPFVTK